MIVTTSACGAPGASTTALGLTLTWPRQALLLEADPAGSTVAPGFLRGGTDHSRGVLNLSLLEPREGMIDAIHHQALALTTQTPRPPLLLMGWADPGQAGAMTPHWDAIGQACLSLDSAGIDVIVDAGRITQGSYPLTLLGYADSIQMFVEGSLTGCLRSHAATTTLAETLQTRSGNPDALALAIVGGDLPASHIRKFYGLPAFRLHHDTETARRFTSGLVNQPSGLAPKFLKSALYRSYRSFAGEISTQIRRRSARLHTPGGDA